MFLVHFRDPASLTVERSVTDDAIRGYDRQRGTSGGKSSDEGSRETHS